VSALVKRSVLLSGHATSVALEPEFWAVLDAIAATLDLSRSIAGPGCGRRRRGDGGDHSFAQEKAS
jgi:hypothetical protein